MQKFRFISICYALAIFAWSDSPISNAPPEHPMEIKAVDLATEFSSLEEENLSFLKEDFNQKYPKYKQHEKLKLIKPNGIGEIGFFNGVDEDSVVLQQEGNEKKIPFKRLNVFDRLRLDMDYRKTWIEQMARLETRIELENKEVVFPEFKLQAQQDFDQAFAWADPEALFQMAEMYRRGIRRKKDMGYVFLFYYLGARQNHVKSFYALGRMYYEGISAPKSPKRGMQLIAIAAEKGNEHAKKFLKAHKISEKRAREAADFYKNRERVEQEAYAKRVEAYQKKYSSRKLRKGRLKKHIGD